MNILVYIYIMFSTLYLIIVLMDIFSDTVGILNSVVSHSYDIVMRCSRGKLVCILKWPPYRQKCPLSYM